jgi:hypothetical protein
LLGFRSILISALAFFLTLITVKLFIATPAHGGTVCLNYVNSMVQSIWGLYADAIVCKVFTVPGDAIISRARNRCVTSAMEWGADKLLFIDSDIGWAWEDMRALVRSDKLVVGGTYPMKMRPLNLNYNVLPEHEHIWKTRSIEEHGKIMELADKLTGEIAIKHLPTGFMMIDMRVFEQLKSKVTSYDEDETGVRPRPRWDFFPAVVKDGRFISEDWAFSSLCHENGIDVYLNTNIICTHMGSALYSVGMA